MLRFQALVTSVKAIAEDVGGGEASFSKAGGRGVIGGSGAQSGEGQSPHKLSYTQCHSFCPKGTGSCRGRLNRRE